MKFVKLSFIIILFPSCSNIKSKPTNLIICNKTEYKIDSVRILSYGVNVMFRDLLQNEIKNQTVNIKAPSNVDGGFTIVIFQKDSIVFAGGFGYFSNGFGIKEKYKVNIMENYRIQEVSDP